IKSLVGSEWDRQGVMFTGANHAHFVEAFASLSVVKKSTEREVLCCFAQATFRSAFRTRQTNGEGRGRSVVRRILGRHVPHLASPVHGRKAKFVGGGPGSSPVRQRV